MVPLCFPVVSIRDPRPYTLPCLRPIGIDDVLIDPFTQEIRTKEKAIKLTKIEFRLLWILGSNPDVVLSREEILCKVWGEGVFVEPRTVDAHIARLRRLLRNETELFPSIETVWGIGYCFRMKNGQPGNP